MENVKLELEQGVLKVNLLSSRIEGEYSIFDAINDFYAEKNEKVRKVVFNFEKIEYINSLGIAEFISTIRFFSEVDEIIKFKFINVEKRIAKIFKMMELNTVADIDTK